jgi:hypothetical protein
LNLSFSSLLEKNLQKRIQIITHWPGNRSFRSK